MIDLSKIDRKKLVDDITEAIMKHVKVDERGRLIFVDKNGKEVAVIEDAPEEEVVKEKSYDDRKAIEEASKMSLQKKEESLVINLPAWLKDRLKKKSNRTGKSMNEIIRLALSEYLAK
jgi:hypothetical protein